MRLAWDLLDVKRFLMFEKAKKEECDQDVKVKNRGVRYESENIAKFHVKNEVAE